MWKLSANSILTRFAATASKKAANLPILHLHNGQHHSVTVERGFNGSREDRGRTDSCSLSPRGTVAGRGDHGGGYENHQCGDCRLAAVARSSRSGRKPAARAVAESRPIVQGRPLRSLAPGRTLATQ